MFIIILGYILVPVWKHSGIYKSMNNSIMKLVPYLTLGCKVYFDKDHPSKMFLRSKAVLKSFCVKNKVCQKVKMIVRPNMSNSNISIWFDDVENQEDITIFVQWNIFLQHILKF